MNRVALRLSLRYGAGDPHWFEKLSREDQALVYAFDKAESMPAGKR